MCTNNNYFRAAVYVLITITFCVNSTSFAAEPLVGTSGFYAYYTREDYDLPLRVVSMNTSDIFGLNPTDVPAGEKKSPGTEGRHVERKQITGKYADVIVSVNKGLQIVFGRKTGYLPYLKTAKGEFSFKRLVECRKDPMCLCSCARIIENGPDKIIVHWRHVPDPHSIVMTEVIHELFTITPGGRVMRQVRLGTPSLDDFSDPGNVTVQKMKLTADGIRELSLSKGKLSRKPGASIDGAPIRKNDVGPPAAWFGFDEGLKPNGDKTAERVSGTVCAVAGNKTLWKKGVSGTALAFDGYFSRVTLPWKKAPEIEDELTLEAWVALGAYPWNDAGIVHQSSGEPIGRLEYKHGYQDPYTYQPWKLKGFMLGIDPYGRPIFKVNGKQVGGGVVKHEQTPDKKDVLPTYRWIHLAGTYGEGKMSLYVNGRCVASRPASGEIRLPRRDVLIGLNGDRQRVSDPVSHSRFAVNNNLPIIYGIEGLIDEVRIYNTALCSRDVKESFESFRPDDKTVANPDLEKRILPGEVTQKPAKKFGASYKTLKYHELWDNLWRPGKYRDIVVRFDTMPANVVFWQGTNFSSNWVVENNKWMSDQSCEIGGPHGCAEHMADKRGRFCRARIIENTNARVVVHWRYPSVDVGYVFPYPDVWADEYYTIYPDGAGVRHVARGKGGWHDIQFLNAPGTSCLDNMNLTAYTLANLSGESVDLRWRRPNHVPGNPLADACIKLIHFKSKYKVFAIYRDGAKIGQWGSREQSKHTTDPFAGPWDHWPVGLQPSDGRYAVADDRVSSAALGGARKTGDFIMYGFTDEPVTSLIPLARSWNNPPAITDTTGCGFDGYKQEQRAYHLTAGSGKMSFSVNASEKSPLCNPCFVISNWGGGRTAQVKINGRLPAETDIRQGVVWRTDGVETLVVWMQKTATEEITVELSR